MTEHKVKFLPSGRIVLVQDGETITQAARKAGVHINAACGGRALVQFDIERNPLILIEIY